MTTNTNFQTFHVTGMDCTDCAKTIERGVAKLDGIQTCELNFTTETLRVSGQASSENIISRVKELGYNVLSPEELKSRNNNETESKGIGFFTFMWRRMDTRMALLAIILVLPGLIFHELLPGLGIHHPIIDISSVLAMVIAGYPVALSGWRALRINREVTINALMSIAAVGAVIIGAYTEAGVVIVLFVIGEALEGFTAGRARESIRSLMAVTPREAVLIDGHGDHYHEKVVPVDSLKVGDRILVKPGKRISMDGVVIAGHSAVNQAPITGESRLIEKKPGEKVFASTVNGEGALEIEVTRLAEDNTISRLIKMVEEAQEKKAPSQRFVDRFAKIYTPIVVGLAALVAVVPPLFFSEPFIVQGAATEGWLYRGLALLVVACPCALVISTPVSIISAISNGARNGVLFKGGAFIEILSRVNTVAFDKTGTLTQGRPSVVSVRSAACVELEKATCEDCEDLLALASAVEGRSEHPIANAVVHEARHRGVNFKYPSGESVKALTGRGVAGDVGGREVVIGSHPYFDENIAHPAHCTQITDADKKGFTTILVSSEAEYQGYIAVADTVRRSSRDALDSLKGIGVNNLIMLTGDNEVTAEVVANEVGVTDFVANCLPEDKVEIVESLLEKYGDIAMVGDGINDTPALARASVGIAIGNTAQAMETADITLMGEDLRQFTFAVRLSRAAMRTIRANVVLAIGIKLVFLVLVLLGAGTMWMAVVADVGASILVTLNGMRLYKRPRFNLQPESL